MAKLLWIAFDANDAAPGASFARAIGASFDLLQLTGEPAMDVGAERVLSAGLAEIPNADALAKALAGQAGGYTHIGAVSAMRSKDVLARLAGLLDAAMVTDAIAAESPTSFKRPMVAGSIIATVEVLSEPVVLTVRPAGFAKTERGGSSPVSPIQIDGAGKTKRIGVSARGGQRPDLTQAKVIVSGGRPLKDAQTFESVIGGFADALGGAAGATRAAVDSGIAANELQVGQTGKIVAPDLYIAAGISGSTQHMAGIKDSKVIVAINKDPDAPIFDFADYGLVADLFEAIPAIREKLGK
ncbi:MAG: electron transfer flavoprotein alpha subunit [Fimbriimonadaceae bacterium]|jgi:electron transfer flavoprotein alpha subunit|nr:electron transfer flavoprotein alpha subunit [Fimbriimonadaceae bacterium]